ncbi:hypothetical protein ABKV19_003832 [Rosa sericea]
MLMTTAIAIEDVRREVKILKALTGHSNLVQFYDAFEDHDNVQVVMEYFSHKKPQAYCKPPVVVKPNWNPRGKPCSSKVRLSFGIQFLYYNLVIPMDFTLVNDAHGLQVMLMDYDMCNTCKVEHCKPSTL